MLVSYESRQSDLIFLRVISAPWNMINWVNRRDDIGNNATNQRLQNQRHLRSHREPVPGRCGPWIAGKKLMKERCSTPPMADHNHLIPEQHSRANEARGQQKIISP